jgi:hypothetical protein
MSPVAFVLLVVGFDRLLSGGRLRAFRRAQPWWLRVRPRLVAFVRSAPATYTYLAILFVTTWVLASASARLADRLLLAESTNLHHLARDPVRVLIGSAFWLSGTRDLIIAACVFTVVLAPVERRIGAWRTAGVFAIGHVGATLLTAAGLWAALRFDAIERSVVNARDVGASYGFFAVAAALTYLLRPSLRRPYATLLLGYVALMIVLSGTFTDYGHLVACLLGFACYPLLRNAPSWIAEPVEDALLRALASGCLFEVAPRFVVRRCNTPTESGTGTSATRIC